MGHAGVAEGSRPVVSITKAVPLIAGAVYASRVSAQAIAAYTTDVGGACIYNSGCNYDLHSDIFNAVGLVSVCAVGIPMLFLQIWDVLIQRIPRGAGILFAFDLLVIFQSTVPLAYAESYPVPLSVVLLLLFVAAASSAQLAILVLSHRDQSRRENALRHFGTPTVSGGL